MAGAPPFDPNKPFEPVSMAAPAFDPGKPFEAVDTSPSTAADMAKSAGSALVKGPVAGVGALGDVRQAARSVGNWVGDQLGLPAAKEDVNAPPLGLPDIAPPTSAEVRKKVEGVTGPLYDAQTKPGKYTERVVEALSNPLSYVGPGGAAVKAGAATLAGIGSEAGEQATGSPWGGVAGGLAAPLAAGAGLTAAANAARRRAIPTTEQLFDASTNAYRAARGYGVEIGAPHVENLANQIVSNLHTEGYRDIAGSPGAPVFRAIEELREPVGVHATIDDIESVRKVLRRMGKNYEHRDAVRRATNEIDDFMANLTPAQVAVNPQFAGRVANTLRNARGNYAAASRAEEIEEALDTARNRAGSTGWGGNTTNAMRQEIRKLEERGLSPAERAQRERIVRGSAGSNAARVAGHWLSPNTLTTPAHLGAIYAGGLPYAGFAAAGMAGRLASGALTRGHINDLYDMVRLRSPLAQSQPPLRPRQTLAPYAMPALVGATNPYQP